MTETLEALFARAVEMQNAGDIPGAIALYRGILGVESRYAVVHANLGAALMAAGDARGAVASYRRALAIEPGRPDTCTVQPRHEKEAVAMLTLIVSAPHFLYPPRPSWM